MQDQFTKLSGRPESTAQLIRSFFGAWLFFLAVNGSGQIASPIFTVRAATGSQLFLTITNGLSGANYELWTTPVLGDLVNHPWTAATVGSVGQTNFMVSADANRTGFYRILMESNANSPWQAVAPNSLSTNEQGASATFPFSQSSVHYQQVFAASQFTNAGTITQIAFRPAAALAGHLPVFPTPVSSVKITLGTTSMAPGGLGTNFAGNFTGNDKITVYGGANGAPWNFSTSYTGPPGGPNAFDVRVYLTMPFIYDPAKGNLLMDVVITNAGFLPPPFDTTTNSSQRTSCLYAADAMATNGALNNSNALVTQFTFGNYSIPKSSHVGWFIFSDNVLGISNLNVSVAEHFFNNPGTLMVGNPGVNPMLSGFTNATPTAYYTSFGAFQSNLLSNFINPVYRGSIVAYDNESWTKTPIQEQNSPAGYEVLFANLAHAYGYVCMTTPSPDLTGYPQPLPPPTRYDVYLAATNCYPAFSSDPPAEVYEIQGQKLETNLTNYQQFGWFNSSAYAEATNANSAIIVFAGITTTPFGTPTASQLEAAVTNTDSYISGYWFNIPDGNYSLAESALVLLQNDGL